MNKLEKQIMEKCSVPVISVKIYSPHKDCSWWPGYDITEVVAEVKFSISTHITGEFIKAVKQDDFIKVVAENIDRVYKEKMELAGIKEAKLEFMDEEDEDED